MKLEDELGCFSYFGFGSGWDMDPDKGRDPTYCQDKCSKSQECWNAHRQRITGIMPQLCKFFDRAARRFGGKHAVKLMVDKYKVGDPYTMSMVCNLQAGNFFRHDPSQMPNLLKKSIFLPPYPFKETIH